MSEEYPMLGVEDILDCFDIDRAYQLIQNQLKSDENSPSGTLTDHLKPMWVRYKNIEIDKDQGITTDVIGIVNTRFHTICTRFIDAIITRYGITIDVGWLENQNKNTLHSLALVLYSFFVLDLESNIKGIYPCGEGAGYAGGITSAAMDGLKIAQQIGVVYQP